MSSSTCGLFHPLESSRKRPRVGDVFVAEIDSGFIGGRVVAVDAQSSAISESKSLLLYIYDGIVKSPDVDAISLAPPVLLIPPVITNTVAWSRGYFQTIGNVPLSTDQLLDQHVFRSPSTKELWDERDTRLPATYAGHDYVGVKALDSYLTIEDAVSRALGFGPTIH